MPFYYDLNRAITTNATVGTETGPDLAVRTIANQANCVVTAVYGSARGPSGTSLAGAMIRLKTMATANTVGTAATPGKRNPNSPAAQTGWFTGATTGVTPTVRMTVGMSAPGGAGGWMAIEPDAGLALLANAGANGNLETFHISGIASTTLDYTIEHKE